MHVCVGWGGVRACVRASERGLFEGCTNMVQICVRVVCDSQRGRSVFAGEQDLVQQQINKGEVNRDWAWRRVKGLSDKEVQRQVRTRPTISF